MVRVRIVSLSLLLTLVLAACGESATPTTTSGTVNQASTATTVPAQPTAEGALPQPTVTEGAEGGVTSGDAVDLASLSGDVAVDGSSTVFPIAEAVAEAFGAAGASNVRVPVGTSGTGGGFKKFCAGETVISNASRPIKAEEVELCKTGGVEFVELPIAYDGLSVIVNPANDFVSCLTTAELKTIWAPEAEGQVTSWNQVRTAFPDQELSLYGPGTDSGTFDYFTAEINGEEGASRGDFTASEDDNTLVQGIAGDEHAIGYFGYAYYVENQDQLKLVEVDGGSGCVAPSPATIADGTYKPLARPLFIYVRTAAMARPEVKGFVDYFLANVSEQAAAVGYVAFPDETMALVAERWAKGTTGSVFSGAKGAVAEILKQ